MKEAIAKLREARKRVYEQLEQLAGKAAAEARDMTDTENTTWTELRAEIDKFDARIADLVEMEERTARGNPVGAALEGEPAPRSSTRVRSRTQTYGRRSGNSFFHDLFKSQLRGDATARERLNVHRQEEEEELNKRVARLDEEGMRSIRQIHVDAEVERRDLTRVAGAGGEFVPPLWLIDEYIALARAARVTADRFNNRPLPSGTNSINIPRITTGTSTAAQTADNAAVSKTDLVTNALTVPVQTIAGQEDVAMQLLEQTPVSFDEIIFQDLMADYNARLDIYAINGSGAAGQPTGILNVAGIGGSTYTSGSPTVPGAYPKVADCMQQIGSNRKLPATAIVMHTRRWGWITAALDSQNRPLVVPTGGNQPVNAMSDIEDVQAQGGPMGNLQGLPVYTDPNIPTNLGAGTNEDRIIVARFSDFWLWEGVLRTRVLSEVLSNTLEVRFQVYNYVALTAARYAASTALVSGTGLVTPTF